MTNKIKNLGDLTLKDQLSHLTYTKVVKLLNPNGEKMLLHGGRFDIDPDTHVELDDDRFILKLYDARVEITLHQDLRSNLQWNCSCGESPCIHVAAAFSTILEEKTQLGLAEAPPEILEATPLSDKQLVENELKEREERANTEKMRVKSQDASEIWTDYLVTNAHSGKTYRVALRGWERGESFCSCPDFRKNTLGTCKHILNVLKKVKKRFPAAERNRSFVQDQIAVHLSYGKTLELRLLLPQKLAPQCKKIVKPIADKAITDLQSLLQCIRKLEQMGESVLVFPDAESYIERKLFQERITAKVAEIRCDPANHPLRESLLKTPLLPYQLDGIAFAVGAGRAILADEMGLGKTIQGIGVAEMLAKEADIYRVLVISPASLKSQWQSEIRRFCDRDCQIVIGSASDRAMQYRNPVFFTLCNYEQVLRDLHPIRNQNWDLIVLDEGQRIKNWEAKTSKAIKSLQSTFALVLSGTPLENRLDDLYSVVEFIDDRRLGPSFRFQHHHRVVDEKGKVMGYRNLKELRKKLAPVLLRRTRASVQLQLPDRTTEVIQIIPTEEQLEISNAQRMTISSILHKKFLTEMDLLRLQKALLMGRMAANSTFLVNKIPPGCSSKLDELDGLLEQLSRENNRKIILFSEWTTMLDLIEPLVQKHSMEFVRLDGSVPQKKRRQLVESFQNNEQCQLFMTTNAGATGLNLQAANTVINIDLPWNPAVLEQRIARAHRMGQKQSVQVYILVTLNTLEENLLMTLSAKRNLAMEALDPDASADEVEMESGMEELKRRLEVLLGAVPEAPVDVTEQQKVEKEIEQQRKISDAGGQLLVAAFQLLGELLPAEVSTPKTQALADTFEKQLNNCLVTGEDGQMQLTVNLADSSAVSNMANSLARIASLSTSE
ncbi:MAG: DEAD/DEAH box helicase [Gammaproteobacteria bacterium]|nr:DEAD/DEAH box helicase [Gammaproteobacteria bacterium]